MRPGRMLMRSGCGLIRSGNALLTQIRFALRSSTNGVRVTDLVLPAAPAARSSPANARPYNRRRDAAARRRDARRPRARAIGLRASPGRRGASPRQHQARLRLRPSRCAILPSLRSLTVAGVNRVAGSRAADARQERGEPARETRRRGRRAPCTAPRSARTTGIRRRPAPTPGSRGRRRTSRARAVADQRSASAGSNAPPIRAPGSARRRVLKCVPTRIG